jgi:ABC-2 type transport system permease protein
MLLLDGGGRTLALARHNVTLTLREPGPLVSRLVQPLVLIALMRPLYVAALARQDGTIQVDTGMLVMFSLLALSVIGSSIFTERTWHTWDRLRATPARTSELLCAKALPALALLIAQQAVILAFGAAVFGLPVPAPGLLAVAVGSWALALLGIGTALGAVARSQSELNVGYDIGGLLLSAMGGALVPLAELPGWARAAAPASPGYWAMTAMRSALQDQAVSTLRAAAVLVAIAVAAGAAATWRISRGWARSRLL